MGQFSALREIFGMAFALCLLAAPVGAEDLLSLDRMTLFSRHQDCNARAEKAFLSQGEAAACAENFLALKLSFMPGASMERFPTLSLATRRDANRKGFMAYMAWTYPFMDAVSESN